jgi:hypothetical protein
VLTDKVLHKIVFAIASMVAISNLTRPVLQLPMPLILVPHPVCLAFERLGLATVRECTGEWLDIFVDVFCPVRWFVELLDLEAKRAFEFRRETLDGREGYAGRKLGGDNGPFRRGFAVVLGRPRCSDLEADEGSIRVFVAGSWRKLLRGPTEIRAILPRLTIPVLDCVEVFDLEFEEALVPP